MLFLLCFVIVAPDSDNQKGYRSGRVVEKMIDGQRQMTGGPEKYDAGSARAPRRGSVVNFEITSEHLAYLKGT